MIYHAILTYLDVDTTISPWMFGAQSYDRMGRPIHSPEQQALLGKTFSAKDKMKALADFIKSSKNDSFVFILVGQYYKHFERFPAWLKEHGLEHLVRVHTEGITNPVHSQSKHNLKLVVLQSEKHFQREEEKEAMQ